METIYFAKSDECRMDLLRVRPFDLKLDFLPIAIAFVLDIADCPDRYRDSFAGDLDFKTFALFQSIGQAAQFLDEFR